MRTLLQFLFDRFQGGDMTADDFRAACDGVEAELMNESTAHRVDSAMYRAEIEELRACLREACECYEADADRVEAHIRGPDPLARWRRVAGLDTANKDLRGA